jgi:hypothetical protein
MFFKSNGAQLSMIIYSFFYFLADRNKMVVTITAPIYPRKFTVGVVGLQLKYMDFVQTMEDAVTIKAVPLTNQEHPLSCKDTVRLYCKQKHYHLSLSFIYIQ